MKNILLIFAISLFALNVNSQAISTLPATAPDSVRQNDLFVIVHNGVTSKVTAQQLRNDFRGARGATGVTGSTGATGNIGATGVTGANGSNGSNGSTGPTGFQGVTGVTGAMGETGVDGIDGPTGLQGITGNDGATGVTGSTGLQGATGADGSLSAWGLTGNTGTNTGTNFIGTSDFVGLNITTDDTTRVIINNTSQSGIGAYLNDATVQIAGSFHANVVLDGDSLNTIFSDNVDGNPVLIGGTSIHSHDLSQGVMAHTNHIEYFSPDLGDGPLLGGIGSFWESPGSGLNSAQNCFVGVDSSHFIIALSTLSTHTLIYATNTAVGLNTTTPSALLDIEGTFKLTDGTEGANRVLTSDATGNASWQANLQYLDSATIYATTPIAGQTYMCSNCTGYLYCVTCTQRTSDVIISWNGTAWTREN